MTSNDSESNKTVHVANESHQDITPPPLVVLDSPDNIDEPRAMIDKGAKATATNLLHLLHKPVFFAEQNSSPVKMHGATAKDMLISPIAKGFLQIPAMTLPGWMEVECCHSPCFTATLLSEQDLLNATCQKSNCSGLTANKLFNKHPDQPQHAIKKGQLEFKKHFGTDSRYEILENQ